MNKTMNEVKERYHCYNDHNLNRNHSHFYQDDEMMFGCDRWPLHYACRIGNLEHVQYLITVRHVPINEENEFNQTPLYLASLTGHTDICQYLLEQGATCDPNTDDSARVFYVALTTQLRTLLQQWSLSAKSRDPYLSSLRKSFNNVSSYPDCIVTFYHETNSGKDTIHDNRNENCKNTVYIHRFMLLARCPKLAMKLVNVNSVDFMKYDNNHDNDDNIKAYLPLSCEDHPPCIMQPILEYLYTGTFDIRNTSGGTCDNDVLFDNAIAAKKIAMMHDISTFYDSVQDCIDTYALSSGTTTKANNCTFRCDINDIDQLKIDMIQIAKIVSVPFKSNKTADTISQGDFGEPKVDINLLAVSDCNECNDNNISDESSFNNDNCCNKTDDVNKSNDNFVNESCNHNDVIIECMNHKWLVHRFRLCCLEQSGEFFHHAFQGNFKEANESRIDLSSMVSDHVPIIQYAIQWIYSDAIVDKDDIDIDLAIQLIEFGYEILCPRLSTYVANAIVCPAVTLHNVFDMLQLVRSYSETINSTLDKLEETCVNIIGTNFMALHNRSELFDIFVYELNTIQQGGDIHIADIPIAAEIRRSIRKHHNINKRLNSNNISTTAMEEGIDSLKRLINKAATVASSSSPSNS